MNTIKLNTIGILSGGGNAGGGGGGVTINNQEKSVDITENGTSDGEYAYVREATPYPSFSNVYDYDFSALVYPKWIRVVCGNKPTVGVVTIAE